MTVLILADQRDVSADRMEVELGRRGIEVFRADLAWFPRHLTLDAEFRDGRWRGFLTTATRCVDLQAVTGAWYRSPTTFEFPPGLSGPERQHAHNEAKLGLGGVLTALPVTWVNHPGRSADAVYRPVHMAAAAASGLAVPDGLVTNDADAVYRFAARHPRVITKMIGAPTISEGGGRRIALTERLTDEHLADLSGIEYTAHHFQTWVPKRREARVIVVGERMFAVAIDAHTDRTRVDWRADYSALSYETVDLPPDVRRGVTALMDRLGLTYGALDFVISPDDVWHYLEINPGGQFGWLEDAVGIPVTSALADVLTGQQGHG